MCCFFDCLMKFDNEFSKFVGCRLIGFVDVKFFMWIFVEGVSCMLYVKLKLGVGEGLICIFLRCLNIFERLIDFFMYYFYLLKDCGDIDGFLLNKNY